MAQRKRKPRQLRVSEIRNLFLDEVIHRINYWEEQSKSGKPIRDCLEGAIQSVFTILDGHAANTPSFIVAPFVSQQDKKFHENVGEDFYPVNCHRNIKGDIAGDLSSELYRRIDEKNAVKK